MNIYALEGHKVIVTEESALNGYDDDKKKVKKHLKINKEYTVLNTSVDNWHTSVCLKEKPGIKFNHVNFEDVIMQSDEENKLHIDWVRYHGR